MQSASSLTFWVPFGAVEEVIPARPHPLYTIKKQVRILIMEERKNGAL